MLNNISVMGRFTKSPELRYTEKNKTPVLLFTLAVDRDYKDADGNRATDFVDCQARATTAEHIAKYFTKGQLCVVHGRLQTRLFDDANGSKRKAVEIIVNSIYFAGKKEATATENAGFVEMPDGENYDLPF